MDIRDREKIQNSIQLIGIEDVKVGRGVGKGQGKGVKYSKYRSALEPHIQWLKNEIGKSKDGKIRVRNSDVLELLINADRGLKSSISRGAKAVICEAENCKPTKSGNDGGVGEVGRAGGVGNVDGIIGKYPTSPISVYWGTKYTLFKEGLWVYQGKHKDGYDLLVIRLTTPDDELPPSLAKKMGVK